MKSKKWAIVRFIALIGVFVWMFVIKFYWPNNILLKVLCILALAITLITHYTVMACPHCGSIGKLPCNLFSQTCGRCRHCGEVVHWKEHIEVDFE